MKTGMFYNPATKEVTAVAESDGELGSQWRHVSDDASMGLLAVRKLLALRGVAHSPTEVYWLMPQPTEEAKIDPACNAPGTAAPKEGFLTRLSGAFRGDRRPPQTVS
jgi:hypothetical protein